MNTESVINEWSTLLQAILQVIYVHSYPTEWTSIQQVNSRTPDVNHHTHYGGLRALCCICLSKFIIITLHYITICPLLFSVSRPWGNDMTNCWQRTARNGARRGQICYHLVRVSIYSDEMSIFRTTTQTPIEPFMFATISNLATTRLLLIC